MTGTTKDIDDRSTGERALDGMTKALARANVRIQELLTERAELLSRIAELEQRPLQLPSPEPAEVST